jgi:hypothetical protein
MTPSLRAHRDDRPIQRSSEGPTAHGRQAAGYSCPHSFGSTILRHCELPDRPPLAVPDVRGIQE